MVKSTEYFEQWKALVSVYDFSGVLVKNVWSVEEASGGLTKQIAQENEHSEDSGFTY